jgi:Lanthionine synthetase C-like protein/Protein kinase domain
MSSIEKFTFSLSHPEFYEPLDGFATQETIYPRKVRAMLPRSWRMFRDNIWLHCQPDGGQMAVQGWKIHLSAVIHSVDALLDAALPVLVAQRTAFKIAAAPTILSLLGSKQWHRGGSGKFMTVYPRGEEHFVSLIEALHRATAGLAGPYILSDRRYRDSKCVFYRYGGIAPRTFLTVKGDRVPYLDAPDGEQVPDRRQAWFSLPPWVRDPLSAEAGAAGAAGTAGAAGAAGGKGGAAAAAAVAAPASRTLRGGRYAIEGALRHTNSGGLYLATDNTTGGKVVLKEARPLTNVDAAGSESKVLLQKERRLLLTLEAAAVAPRVVDFFQEWEHWFLVEEFLDGVTLRQHSILHNVTRLSRPSPSHFDDFYRELRSVFGQLANILEIFGRHRIVFRDLSPTNVLILRDGVVKLVDFEAACELGVDPMSNLFTPGYASSDHFSSDLPQVENDYFSLGALMLAYLMPMHAAMGLDIHLHHRFIRAIGDDYGFPRSLVRLINRLMSREPARRPAPAEVQESLANPSPVRRPLIREPAALADGEIREAVERSVRYILGHCTPERGDRLFPCDAKVFATNPLSLAYGACGTAYALHRITGVERPAIADWILGREVTAEQYAPGLYLGMAGIAWTLLELGLVEPAKRILALSGSHPVPLTADVYYGLAGWGMTQLKFHLATGEPRYLEAATAAGRRLLETRVPAGGGAHWSTPPEQIFGFAHGASGVGVFLLYLYLAGGDEEFLSAGREALEFDLAQAVDLDEGLLWPSRTGPARVVVPYWRYGSAGVGAALLRFHRVAPDERYRSLLDGIRIAATRKYAIFPARGFGLAGLGEFLLDMAALGSAADREECLAAACRVAAGVMLFRLDKGGEGIAFPGADLWKISCDYATGSAGIALFLDRLLTRRPADFMLDELLPAGGLP